MRWILLSALILLVVGCVPEADGNGILSGVGEDKQETQRLVGNAISGDYDSLQRACTDDLECGLGRMCQNQTCVLKPAR